MTLIKIDRDTLVEELYLLKSMIPVENIDAREHLQRIIEHVIKAPNDKAQNNYPRMQTRRC